jgi:predicted Zn-dependent protease with MMP-like domain
MARKTAFRRPDRNRDRVARKRVSAAEFERLVESALRTLPRKFSRLMSNVAVTVAAEATAEELLSVGLRPGRGQLFGLYQGVPLSERGVAYSALPDKVVIFRHPILRRCRTRPEIVGEIRDTLIHEIGHHFGMREEELPY